MRYNRYMNKPLYQYFEDYFSYKCNLTPHGLDRLKKRFLASELQLLRLLIKGGLKQSPIEDCVDQKIKVFSDEKYGLGLVFKLDKQAEKIVLITFLRGKSPESYKDETVIKVSISKEKALEEVEQIKKAKARI